ncbi:helix-turn-helix protein [Lacinutrix venerupis]|uniref:helix-turn-helix domain-containing protein n=1 Tax=Lacinutrix venerupis TaxID=1486034 RepID=UPI000EAFA464|nr:helix-turn-helix domain-containing protein [Lacinutrix venerupis]RLJ61598.1 helix-turn-helix protein [Lacinutrix venerupis]
MKHNQTTIDHISFDELKSQIIEAINNRLKLINFNQKKELEELLTVEETLAILKCSKQALWNWRKNGILPSYRMGNRVYYKRSDIFAKLIKQD